MPLLSLLLSSAVLAGALAPTQPAAAPPAMRSAMTVHLMTVIDNPDALGGVRVQVPVLAVRQVIAPRLVVVSEPRIVGVDRTYQPMFGYDRLLVLLPAETKLSRGQVVNVTGEVHTVAGARATGLPVDEGPARVRKDNSWIYADRAAVLVADSVETADGVPLVGSNRKDQ